ncbi:MAG: serine/threonine protein kinase [Planctomycetaceae bacterium]|jgi:serine/threonine protein kinase|nr:serine/threonine protein kinase [Planctomycetaceae bacterium]
MRQPEKLGPFRITQQLGKGGMGAVYQGANIKTGEPVAVKVLLDNFDDESPEARRRFEAEIEALRMLRHPNIVRLNGYGQEGDLLYYVMELVCGTTLYKELRKKRGFFWQEVAKIGYDVCLALKHGHDRGITHRDLKPANIMLDNSGTLKIADYGIAHCFGASRLTSANAVIGTIEFMSPEQAVAGPIGPKSDLYSLGAVLYALLCRRPPYLAKTLSEIISKHQSEPPEDASHFRQDIPVELLKIIRGLLERDPKKRPNNAFLAARRFANLLESEFGAVNAAIVLPSRFDESPAVATTSDATRTETSDSEKPNESKSGAASERTMMFAGNSDDSQAFSLRHDITPDKREQEKTVKQSQTNAPISQKISEQIAKTDVSTEEKREREIREELNDSESDAKNDISRQSPNSVYRDLTNNDQGSEEILSQNITRQTSAFEHLKSYAQADRSEEKEKTSKLPQPNNGETTSSNNTSDTGRHSTAEQTDKIVSSKAISKFTPVYEEELGGYRRAQCDNETRPFISIQVGSLSICLVVLGLWAWWMLLPPSADKLYQAIDQRVRAGNAFPRQSAILAAETNIKKFAEIYPQDRRISIVLQYQKEIDLAHLERALERNGNALATDKQILPVQRAYLEAIAFINTAPEETIERLEALITLYEITAPQNANDEETTNKNETEKSKASAKEKNSIEENHLFDAPDLSNPISMTVELARRKLVALRNEIASIHEIQAEQLVRTLERIDRINAIDPQKAAAMKNAVLKLYSDKSWAKKTLDKIKE